MQHKAYYINKKILTLVMLSAVWFLFVQMTNKSNTKKVHGTATMIIDLSDNITMSEAKVECVKKARCEAIKEAFGETIVSNTNMVDAEVNGQDLSQFVEETNLMLQAEWLRDTKEPEVTIAYEEGKLIVKAEVWGEASEMKQPQIDLKWKVLCGGTDDRFESSTFKNKERVYVSFRAPVAGYVAIYLLDSNNKEASCLLPYKTNASGMQKVAANKKYIFFDRNSDPKAIGYNLTTKAPVEIDQVVLIFSPHPFAKCAEITGDRRHPNSLAIEDFTKWLNKLRTYDSDMVIDKTKYLKITNGSL